MILLLLACVGPKPGASVPAHDTAQSTLVDTGPPALPTIEATSVQPTLTATEVAETLTIALSQAPDPTEILEAYRFLMTQGDEVCPGPGMNIVDTWLYGCDASTGYSYAGVTDWFDEPHSEGGMDGTMTGIAGDFWIDTPDGQQLEGGGHSVTFRNSWIWIGEIAGSWHWDGGTEWLRHGFSGQLTMEYISNIELNMRGAANINGTHISATDLSIANACGGPVGGLSLRDPEGGWHKMMFTNCDPCAQVVFEGTDLGQACVDFDPFLTQMEARL